LSEFVLSHAELDLAQRKSAAISSYHRDKKLSYRRDSADLMTIQGQSRLSVVVPIDAAYNIMTSC